MLVRVELYSFIDKEFIPIQGLIDTGAGQCVIAKHIAEELGLQRERKEEHRWQVHDPLIVDEVARVLLRYEGKIYKNIETDLVDIPEKYRRNATENEVCTRPYPPHPLSSVMLLGTNFLDKAGLL